jgi:hypothetical protein
MGQTASFGDNRVRRKNVDLGIASRAFDAVPAETQHRIPLAQNVLLRGNEGHPQASGPGVSTMCQSLC